MRQLVFISQTIIQIFVAVGALVCGLLLIIDPSDVLLQMHPDILKDSPFHDFLAPGVILFLVNGVGQLFAGLLSIRRHRFAGYVGAVFGIGLMTWIFVQVNMIGGRHILQYSYFLFGLLETALSFSIHNYLTAAREQRTASSSV